MALIVTATQQSQFKLTPQGAHIGRCYRVIDLGTQTNEWQGKKRVSRKVMISWELFGEEEDGTPLKMEDGRPLAISKRYTLSLSEKANLRADLESWRGRGFTDDELQGFDLKTLLGVYGIVNVTHSTRDGKTYANVASLTPLPKAMKDHKPIPVNENQFFDVTEPDMEAFELFSDKLKETIKACQEWSPEAMNKVARKNKDGVEGLEDDTIPF